MSEHAASGQHLRITPKEMSLISLSVLHSTFKPPSRRARSPGLLDYSHGRRGFKNLRALSPDQYPVYISTIPLSTKLSLNLHRHPNQPSINLFRPKHLISYKLQNLPHRHNIHQHKIHNHQAFTSLKP